MLAVVAAAAVVAVAAVAAVVVVAAAVVAELQNEQLQVVVGVAAEVGAGVV